MTEHRFVTNHELEEFISEAWFAGLIWLNQWCFFTGNTISIPKVLVKAGNLPFRMQ